MQSRADGRRLEPSKGELRWLLDSDPAIRWQVMQDLAGEPPEAVAEARSRVAFEGWGARLLVLQGPDGRWGGTADDEPPYVYTTNALVLLKEMGVDPTSAPARRAIERVKERVTWKPLGGRPFFGGEVEPCINGRILAAGAYFGEENAGLVDRLLSEQLPDGGWNCEPSRRSSFHTTICVLEGLLEYEKANGSAPAVSDARARAHEYLLERRMMYSLSTGKLIDKSWTLFVFPTTWHYHVLRGLDYLRSAGVEPDERAREAVLLVQRRQHQNGRWPAGKPHPDSIDFDVEAPRGTASRWNTLRAYRVLGWGGDLIAGASEGRKHA